MVVNADSQGKSPRFLDRLRLLMRGRQISEEEIADHVRWAAGFIHFHGLRHPRELASEHVAAYVDHVRREPESTPNREAAVRAALKFLYEEFLPVDGTGFADADEGAAMAARRRIVNENARNSNGPSSSPFLNRCHQVLRVRHYSIRTEECYVNWIKRFILFHNKRHPAEMGGAEIEAFLTHLAVDGQVSASTQNQALNALVFLYKQVLEIELSPLNAVRAKRPARLPVVMSRKEVRQVLGAVEGAEGLFQILAELEYGTGMRVLESCRVRVHDVDVGRGQILIRDGKGGKDRVVMLPRAVRDRLIAQIEKRRTRHRRDLANGHGWVWLPDALARKYPHAPWELGWQFLFASKQRSRDPRSCAKPRAGVFGESLTRERGTEGERETGWGRHHVNEGALARAVKQAVRETGQVKHITCHTFRHAST